MLEGQFALVLANAQHIKNVPGRKTDVNDAMWIADLLAHGLIRSSFVPIQDLRDRTCTRKQLVREIAQHCLPIQKALEDANIKLGSVLSVLSASGRAILWAIIGGESDPERLADPAKGTARRKRPELIEALRGRVSAHHRMMLKLHLGPRHFNQRQRDNTIRRLMRRLHDLGCQISLSVPPPAQQEISSAS
jgi:hypothetical protein